MNSPVKENTRHKPNNADETLHAYIPLKESYKLSGSHDCRL